MKRLKNSKTNHHIYNKDPGNVGTADCENASLNLPDREKKRNRKKKNRKRARVYAVNERGDRNERQEPRPALGKIPKRGRSSAAQAKK